jgi:Inner membrane protein YgaP-like, transmembrane domain
MYLLKTDSWYLERILFLMAGVFILASVILTIAHSPWWLILTSLVGINQVIYALTGFCPSAILLFKIGIKPRLERTEKQA